MLAIGRALATNPRLLILDEATEGLAPIIRDEIWKTIRVIGESGIATLVVDKSVAAVTEIADRVVIIVKGEVAFEGPPGDADGRAGSHASPSRSVGDGVRGDRRPADRVPDHPGRWLARDRRWYSCMRGWARPAFGATFPDKVARRTGCPAVVYSRLGYGRSDALSGRRTTLFMHEEAREGLPRLLDLLKVSRPVLIGHSDGASIALIAAGEGTVAARGLVLMAPHVMVEEVTIDSIARIRERYGRGDLKARLGRYHDHVDDAFLGWADTWLSPEFRDWSIDEPIGRIGVPMLLIQGEDDAYGTPAQLERIEALAEGPVARLLLGGAGHAPQRDREADVLAAIEKFTNEII